MTCDLAHRRLHRHRHPQILGSPPEEQAGDPCNSNWVVLFLPLVLSLFSGKRLGANSVRTHSANAVAGRLTANIANPSALLGLGGLLPWRFRPNCDRRFSGDRHVEHVRLLEPLSSSYLDYAET